MMPNSYFDDLASRITKKANQEMVKHEICDFAADVMEVRNTQCQVVTMSFVVKDATCDMGEEMVGKTVMRAAIKLYLAALDQIQKLPDKNKGE